MALSSFFPLSIMHELQLSNTNARMQMCTWPSIDFSRTIPFTKHLFVVHQLAMGLIFSVDALKTFHLHAFAKQMQCTFMYSSHSQMNKILFFFQKIKLLKSSITSHIHLKSFQSSIDGMQITVRLCVWFRVFFQPLMFLSKRDWVEFLHRWIYFRTFNKNIRFENVRAKRREKSFFCRCSWIETKVCVSIKIDFSRTREHEHEHEYWIYR